MRTMYLAALTLAALACTSPGSAPAPGVESRGEELADVFERVQSSVVTILTVGKAPTLNAQGMLSSTGGVGSGVLISEAGRILTAAHVVQTADALVVQFANGTRVPARIVASIPQADIALVELAGTPPRGAHVAELADSDGVRVASPTFVVGAPLGISHTLTVGHVSARRRSTTELGGLLPVELFQTDASINSGNSGGPMFDMDGRVIGIVSHIATRTGGSQGLGFAVTANVCRELLLEGKAIWSGIDTVFLPEDLARALNVPGGYGALVQIVADGSPGARLGLRGGTVPVRVGDTNLLLGGDIVLKVCGMGCQPSTARGIFDLVHSLGGQEDLSVEILRAGERLTLHAKIADLVRP